MKSNIDEKNKTFWDELCGTQLSKSLGIIDNTYESLKIYDNYYLNFYPYLLQRVPVSSFTDKDVLEGGLGFGTLSQILINNSKSYTGLDIAPGPVEMVNHRIANLPNCKAIRGSIKDAPFVANSFDVVVAIGCYHHTGDLEKAIEETHRILKRGGKCYLMVYNKFSYRMWLRWPIETFFNFVFNQRMRFKRNVIAQSKASDTNNEGVGAPETQYYSISELERIMKKYFCKLRFKKENVDDYKLINRTKLLGTVGKAFGLDIYFSGIKVD